MGYCEQCGKQIDDETFCGNCGSKIPQDSTPSPQSKAMDISAAKPIIPVEESRTPSQKPVYDRPTYPQPMDQTSPPYYAPMQAIMPPERSYLKWFGLIFGSLFVGIIFIIIGLTALIAAFLDESYGNFFFLLFLGFILIGVGGIAQLVYAYHNFNDFRLLNRAGHGYPDDSTDPVLGIVLYFVLAPIAVYFKYNQLHRHLNEKHTGETTISPNPLYVILLIATPYVLPFIITPLLASSEIAIIGFFGILPFVVFVIPLIMLYFEYSWQKSLNEHIRNHKKYQLNQSPLLR